MKPAKHFADEFCTKHVINSRGNVIEDFVREIQQDAINSRMARIETKLDLLLSASNFYVAQLNADMKLGEVT